MSHCCQEQLRRTNGLELWAQLVAAAVGPSSKVRKRKYLGARSVRSPEISPIGSCGEGQVDGSCLFRSCLLRDFEQQWLEQLEPRRQRVVLDIDATDDPTHGAQQLTFFHGSTTSTCTTRYRCTTRRTARW
jgi:hypothetical protein